MSTGERTAENDLERFAPLWGAPASPPRWVIWHPDADTMVFDRRLNLPVPIDDASLAEVLRRMREAGAPESTDYPGRACG
ncbi:hypothetical protein [Streptomyces sp. CB02261]|uniref:hypothetical protein n=1 Tax=Streptomyces sp. CB02261 TaxID=1703940 RepID=UPI00093B82F5|nr:hypothetical protein [Streptomyces sp. CB02261]OKJ63944.1 hypothetical protein AMK29_17670 [Streptomyces sp. CB02261]